jgi:hypothetical protein
VHALQGQSNLRSDPALSQRRIEALISQEGIPTIAVKQGDLVVQQGERISPQAFDVLDFFGVVNRRPRPLAWLGHFLESLAVGAAMLLVLRRWRPSLEPRQALLALASLLAVEGVTLWLGPIASPILLLVPPTLLLAEGLGGACGLAWLAAACLLWPVASTAGVDLRLLVAAGTGAVVPAFLRNEAGGVDLLVLQSNGAVARHAYTGNALAPYANPASSGSILPDMIVNGRALSVADVNGDGRVDILDKEGWREQPADTKADSDWKFHPQLFTVPGGRGGSSDQGHVDARKM